MHFSAATAQGECGVPNEDWAGASPTVAVVLDGVTIPRGAQAACEHGTPWYVNYLGSQLLAHAANPGLSLADALANAIRAVTDSHARECDLSRIGAPSAAVAAVRVGELTVDYLVLADVMIVLDSGTELAVISDTRVANTVDDLAGRPNVAAEIMDRRKKHRNKPGGYWVAAGDPAAAAEAVTGHLPRASFRHAALMTDGVSRLVSPFEKTDWRGLLELALTAGTPAVIEQVRAIEAGDPQGERWPRFKISDDATIAVTSPELTAADNVPRSTVKAEDRRAAESQ